MTYWALNAFVLAAVAIVAIAAIVSRRAPRWLAVLIAAGILLVFTAIFDNVLIGLGFVGYDRALISGVLVGRAPIEDFAYTVAAVVLLPSLWTLLTRKPRRA
jgi:lycopene cyclase domain-containing protein